MCITYVGRSPSHSRGAMPHVRRRKLPEQRSPRHACSVVWEKEENSPLLFKERDKERARERERESETRIRQGTKNIAQNTASCCGSKRTVPPGVCGCVWCVWAPKRKRSQAMERERKRERESDNSSDFVWWESVEKRAAGVHFMGHWGLFCCCCWGGRGRRSARDYRSVNPPHPPPQKRRIVVGAYTTVSSSPSSPKKKTNPLAGEEWHRQRERERERGKR